MSGSDPVRTLVLASLLVSLAAPILAQTPLTGDEFAAHVAGKTVTYQRWGNIFGIEQYLEGGKVRWSPLPGECQSGRWYPEGDNICFLYEYDPVPHCWTFWKEGDALVALSDSGLPGQEIYETDRSTTPLDCSGPDVGV
jgi:hypothetical protein